MHTIMTNAGRALFLALLLLLTAVPNLMAEEVKVIATPEIQQLCRAAAQEVCPAIAPGMNTVDFCPAQAKSVDEPIRGCYRYVFQNTAQGCSVTPVPSPTCPPRKVLTVCVEGPGIEGKPCNTLTVPPEGRVWHGYPAWTPKFTPNLPAAIFPGPTIELYDSTAVIALYFGAGVYDRRLVECPGERELTDHDGRLTGVVMSCTGN